MKMLVKKVFIVAGSMAMAVSAAVQAEEKLQLTAVTDRAQGQAIVAGDYRTAIANLNAADRRFASSTNLCVALAATGELQHAQSACEAALQITERSLRHADFASERALQRDLALALSNMGVISVMSGEAGRGEAYFERASELRAGLAPVDSNLKVVAAE